MLFESVFGSVNICNIAQPKWITNIFFMFLIEKSFNVVFEALAEIYSVDDFLELVLYIGSSKDSAGIMYTFVKAKSRPPKFFLKFCAIYRFCNTPYPGLHYYILNFECSITM